VRVKGGLMRQDEIDALLREDELEPDQPEESLRFFEPDLKVVEELDIEEFVAEGRQAAELEQEGDHAADYGSERVEQPYIFRAAGEKSRLRAADEFLCESCFLVKHRRQLADATRLLCVDCVNSD
jgi:hypothetical protein